MHTAKNTLVVKIDSTETQEYAILNPISGSFDLLNQKDFDMLDNLKNGLPVDSEFSAYLLERGYVYANPEAEQKAVEVAYQAFQEEIKNSQVQLMLIPTYSCNLACTYCFQHGIEGRPTLISEETVDAFFTYAAKHHGNHQVKPFITLFGGEPLINSPAQRRIIEYIVSKCVDENYELSIVTNGYDLVSYIDLLKQAKIKEIQITLDGSQKVHDERRGTANKQGTFARIIEGVNAAVENKMPINMRSVVDMENIEDIVNLAEYLDGHGWLNLPPKLFKTQIGRNYELFECYAKPQHLMSQIELWAEFSRLSKEYPVLSKLHRPDFKGIRHVVDTGEMYLASFDTCPAAKTEWVFDLYGDIYGCTASCGRKEYLLGTYWPEENHNAQSIATWQKRDVTSISKCRDCQYDVICGGGCGVVAANTQGGEILSPDCRPIGELLEIGVKHYHQELKALAEDTEETSSSGEKNTKGCILCGAELVYLGDSTSIEKCQLCNKEFETNVKCSHGHFICDACHSKDLLGIVENLLLESTSNNPTELASQIFDLPELNMHGPEYHSIVPGVIITAYFNSLGIKNPGRIQEALRRGKDIKGGSCGYYGSCGAGIGSGIASSVIENATPLSGEKRGNANRLTALALLEISKSGGPRCCKRDAMTSIRSFMENTDYFKGVEILPYSCKQHKNNKECIGIKCPYFPKKK